MTYTDYRQEDMESSRKRTAMTTTTTTQTDLSSTPWHLGLTGKLSWTTIGLMSSQLKARGIAADARTQAALSATGAR